MGVIMFNRRVVRAAIAAVAFAVSGQESRAESIVGSAAFDYVFLQPTPTPGNLDTATGIAFPTPAFTVDAARTGGYLGLLATGATGNATGLIFSGTASTSTLALPFVLDFNPGNVGGARTFTAASGSVSARTFSPHGVLGATLFGQVAFSGFTPTPGIVTLTFSQTAGPDTAIAGTGTLASPFPVASVLIPAPATVVLASLGGVMVAGARSLRRRFA